MAGKLDRSSPLCPAEWDVADIVAMQALERGEADKDQQQRALQWILRASCIGDLSYRPGSERDTAFAEGKRFVGLQIHKLLILNARAFSQNTKEK